MWWILTFSAQTLGLTLAFLLPVLAYAWFTDDSRGRPTPDTVGTVPWPNDAVQYAQVPSSGTFTAETVPPGLLGRHNTKSGTWGRIIVVRGALRYSILEPGPEPVVFVLRPGTDGVVQPQVYHSVALMSPDTEFVVQFWRRSGASATSSTPSSAPSSALSN